MQTLHLTRREMKGIRHGSSVIAACVAMVFGLLAAPVTAATHHSAKTCRSANGVKVTNALVCKGLAFYKGKTMTYINVGSIGGPFDDPGIAMQPYLEKYLGVSYQITSYPTGNTIPGQDQIAHATPDGLTIGPLNQLNDVSDILTNTPGINFNPARLAYLIQAGVNASPFLAKSGSGITNFKQLFTLSKAGKLKVLSEQTGTLTTILRILMGTLGLNPQYVTGYSKLADEVQGFIRGDAPLGLFDMSLVCGLMQSNQAVALATNVVPPAGTKCRSNVANAPTYKDLEKMFPPKTKKQKQQWISLNALVQASGTPIVTQTSVPAYKVATLRAALQWTFKQPGFRTTMLNFGLNPTPGNPVKAKKNYQQLLSYGKSILCYIPGAKASC